jgi:hypothetical protein
VVGLKAALSPLSLLAAAAVTLAGCEAAASDRPQSDVTRPGAVAAEPALQQVDGTLRHLFSVPFTADRSIVAGITGLVTAQVARTATGGEIEIAFPRGVPYPQGAGAVTVLAAPKPDRGMIFDHLAPPPDMPEREGQAIVSSYRIAGRPTQYLMVWRDGNAGEHSITLFDTSHPQAPGPVIARSRAPILGVAHQPSAWAADYNVVVWTMAREGDRPGGQRQVMVESYTWRPSSS